MRYPSVSESRRAERLPVGTLARAPGRHTASSTAARTRTAAPTHGSRPTPRRRDSWPPNGGPPGSDVDFIRKQLLDPYNIAYGVLEPLLGGNTSRNLDEAAALCGAMNDWQAHEFVDPEPRLRASILIPLGRPRSLRQGNRKASRRLAIRPDPARLQNLRAARAPPLLADLRRRPGQQPVHRLARRRHPKQRPVRRRLAAILHRGPSRPGPLDAESGRQHDPGRRLRSLPQIESRADRGWLRLGPATRAGGWTRTGRRCATKCRT